MGGSGTESLQVTIKLTPLGQDEEENHRVITLNNEKREFVIGRASKNPGKGLLAERNNAWFNYPILSRTHAMFTASPHQREVYLQDCGSTHGTFLDKQRLEAGIPYIITNGELITFGQRVTSGAITYPAKEFRVHSEWGNYSLGTSSVFSRILPCQLGFRVPEEDHDSYSDQSRESSVQVIESHPRTYSIPSSSDGGSDSDEDDKIEITSSVQGEEVKGSIPTTPDRGSAVKKDSPREVEAETPDNGLDRGGVRGLNLKGPSLHDLLSKPITLGNSQENPIDIESASVTKHIARETESEDDGPEILPIAQLGMNTREHPDWQKPQITRQQHHPPTMADDLDTQFQRKSVIPETQRHQSKEQKPVRQLSSELLESLADATDDFDSEDEDGFDHDDDFSDFNPEKDIDNEFSFLETAGSRQEPVKQSSPHPQGTSDPSYSTYRYPYPSSNPVVSMSEGIDVSQPGRCFLPLPSFSQRAPSPSDAALARKVDDPKPTLHRSHISDSTFEFDSSAFEAHPSGTERVENSHYAFPPAYYPYPELKTPKPRSKPYEQGPFSTRDKDTSTQFQPSRIIYRGTPTPLERAQTTSKYNSCKVTYDSIFCSEPRKASDGSYSKINISSIVNAPSESGSKGLKRKAEDMCISCDEGITGVEGSSVQLSRQPPPPSPYSGNPPNNETPLPDAQARDVLPPVEVAPLSQDSNFDADVRSTSVTRATNTEPLESPPRKKAKTASSSSGIVGFVSGICLGLAAAAAGFVATIPSSVREEALRELPNGV